MGYCHIIDIQYSIVLELMANGSLLDHLHGIQPKYVNNNRQNNG